ncbi:branched-chain amino acid ABC transporter permease [Agromyces mangrovi Wang et al. 2018]|uniref:branched-chain amino acid ABC transporter permease n=1 Tax=Agromyces mangrovi TaxID=1858653 RepID=UPI0025736E94|nr:branched-chain amino acid ABC transporter permease [Agromyces mangrovi]BDZ64331.1 branched-chain amino acid ABC transporter permease [Agromyces mangrovi]
MTTTTERPADTSETPAMHKRADASGRRPAHLGTVRGRYAVAAIGLVLAVGATFLLDPYRNYLLSLTAAYVCATAGLTLLVGRTGQLSLGHAAFMATGAYAFALTSNGLAESGIEGPVLLVAPFLVAVIAATAFGTLVGAAGARLHGPYLAGLTLAIVLALPAVTSTFSSALGGDQGLYVQTERRPEALSTVIANEQWQAWVALVAAAIVLVLLAQLGRSPSGIRMQAVRDDTAAARLSGIDPFRVKVQAFAISAGAAGLGGAVLAYVTQAASPGAYGLAFSLFLLVAVVVGGTGTLPGAVWGALLLVLLPEAIAAVTDTLPLPDDAVSRLDGNLAVLIFGALLVVIMIAAPRGIQGALVALRGRIRSRTTRTTST